MGLARHNTLCSGCWEQRRVAVVAIGTSQFQLVHTRALYLFSAGPGPSDSAALRLLHYTVLARWEGTGAGL